MVKVKICGITTPEDALAAVEYGADALGFIFFKESPRYVDPEKAKQIVSALPPFITTVGVFVNEDPAEMKRIMEMTGINILQLHGEESPDVCEMWPKVIKAFRVRNFTDLEPLRKYRVAAYLLDAYSPQSYGGTGQIFNWDIAVEAKRYGNVILSGGLCSENIQKAIAWVNPYGVDASSGLEKSRGRKDYEKLKTFIAKAKACVSQNTHVLPS